MSQADHVLNMLSQITTGLHDKELEYSAAIAQSCTFIANEDELKAAEEALTLLYNIQQVLDNWRKFMARLSEGSQIEGSPASKLLTVSAELMDVMYTEKALMSLLSTIKAFMAEHYSTLPELTITPEVQPNPDMHSLVAVDTGDTLFIHVSDIVRDMNERLSPEKYTADNWQEGLEDMGWELATGEDFDEAVARADRTT